MHVLFFPASKNVLFFTSFGSGLNGCTFRWLWTRSVLNPKTAKQWCSLDTNKLLSIWKLPSPKPLMKHYNPSIKSAPQKHRGSNSWYESCGKSTRRAMTLKLFNLQKVGLWTKSEKSGCWDEKKKQKTWEISRDCNRLKAELCGFSNFSKRGVEEPLIDALIRWQWFGHREKSRRFIQMAINQ